MTTDLIDVRFLEYKVHQRSVSESRVYEGGAEAEFDATILDSSMVEHSAVNRGVVGSSPTRGVSQGIAPGTMAT